VRVSIRDLFDTGDGLFREDGERRLVGSGVRTKVLDSDIRGVVDCLGFVSLLVRIAGGIGGRRCKDRLSSIG
jgi:hypothetical protein